MKIKLFFLKNPSQNEYFKAFCIVLLIAIMYLHPMFLGKVDTPIDIRNVLMYPWRFHTVDSNVQNKTLWQSDKQAFELITLPLNTNKTLFDLQLSTISKSNKISNSNFYISFNFKLSSNEFDFILSLINKTTKQIFTLPYAVSPLTGELKGWNKAYFNLNSFISQLSSLDELNNYAILISTQNQDSNNTVRLYLKDLKLSQEDFSKIPVVHNYYINDLVQMFTPFREYFSDSIKKFNLPFWNNYIFGGTEFLAEPQVGYLHPLYLLSYFLFDHFTAHLIVSFISFILCGFGAFLLCRHWGFNNISALFTGIVYMFHPFNVTWFSYEHVLMNSATLPFLILFYEKNLSSSRLLNKYLICSAFLLGLIFLSGHLQYIYYSALFFFLFCLFRLLVSCFSVKKLLLKHAFSIFFVFSISVMIGAVILIPFFPLLSNSHRVANSSDFIQATSFPLKALAGLIYPFYGGFLGGSHTTESKIDSDYLAGFFNNYVYFGFLPLVFSLFSLKRIFSSKLTLFFICSILISFLICTGSPVYFLVRDFLPGFKQMQHIRFLELYSYSIPFLSGIGFHNFLNYLTPLNKWIRKVFIFGIIVVTVVDLMLYSSFFITWSKRSEYKPLPSNGALEFLLRKQKELGEPFRVLPFAIDRVDNTKLKVNISQPNTLLPYGLEDVSGYSSFVPKDIYNLFIYIQTKDLNKLYKNEMVNLFSNPNIPFPIYNFKSKILDLLNVKYFLVPSILTIQDNKVKKIFDYDCAIYENLDYLPRAFIVPGFKVISDPKETIAWLDSEQFNPRKEVILMSLPDIIANNVGAGFILPQLSNDVKYNVKFIKYENNNITLKVNVDSPGFLILGHNLNNNWKVKVNGKEDEHVQANLVQRAVYLPKAGAYKIEFYYFPKLFLIGLIISCFSLLILVFLVVGLKFIQKPKNVNFQSKAHNGKITANV